ncbi:MAG: TetR/AcrR family transcriptional regulator [Clostridiales bacterium]
MQVQKNQVRKRIMDAALQEFFELGYKHASIRSIARTAEITPGNIYAYFAGKEQLFDAVVLPTMMRIRTVMEMEFPPGTPYRLERIVDAIVTLFREEKRQVMILLNGSEGSKYVSISNNLRQVAARRIEEDFRIQHEDKPDPLLCESLAAAVIAGLIYLINHCDEDERLSLAVKQFLRQIFNGVMMHV